MSALHVAADLIVGSMHGFVCKLAQHVFTLPGCRAGHLRTTPDPEIKVMSDYAVVIRMLFFALSLMAFGAARAQVPEDTSEQGAWGTWGKAAYCPDGQYVWGFRLKSEPYQGSGDDSALNAVRLICKSGASGAVTYIQSDNEGAWGDWGNDHICRSGAVDGFAIQVESYQGRNKDINSKDDTAAGNIMMFCGSEVLVGDPPAAWGDWSRMYYCTGGKVRGFRTKVEPDQGNGDDTALNAMQVYCGL